MGNNESLPAQIPLNNNNNNNENTDAVYDNYARQNTNQSMELQEQDPNHPYPQAYEPYPDPYYPPQSPFENGDIFVVTQSLPPESTVFHDRDTPMRSPTPGPTAGGRSFSGSVKDHLLKKRQQTTEFIANGYRSNTQAEMDNHRSVSNISVHVQDMEETDEYVTEYYTDDSEQRISYSRMGTSASITAGERPFAKRLDWNRDQAKANGKAAKQKAEPRPRPVSRFATRIDDEGIEREPIMDKNKPILLFATMKFSKRAVYSDLHHVWTIDEDWLNELPPPHTPYTKKSEIFEPLMHRHVDKRAYKVPKTVLNGPLCDLVSFLTSHFDDDLSKLRALYIWLASQNIPRLKLPIKPAKEGMVLHYLDKLKKRKGNYAQLMSHMCNLAELPCVVVHGYLKGSTYEIGQHITKETHYGEWNAVLIDSHWRFVNAYWGACSIGNEVGESTTYKPDENFFLTDPEQLSYTHYPQESIWQLCDASNSVEEFQKKAYLKERFFELSLRILSHPNCEIKVEGGETEILFGIDVKRSLSLQFMCLVYLKEDQEYRLLYDDDNRFQQDFIYRPTEDALAVKIRFPKRGIYRIEIVGKDTKVTKKDYDYDWVAIYRAVVVSGPTKYTAFPKCGDNGWGNDFSLKTAGLKPDDGQLKTVLYAEEGQCNMSFKMMTPESRDLELTYKMVTVNIGLDEVPLESGFNKEGSIVSVDVTIPPGDEAAFCLFAQMEDEAYGSIQTNLCNYLVVSTPLRELDNTLKKDIDSVREKLETAVHFKQLTAIERAIDLIETKRYERHMHLELQEAREILERLRVIAKLMHDVLAMDQRTIAEIRFYSNPAPPIHIVMQATLLLLGNYEEETRDWKNIQMLLGKTGRGSLKRRINMFDISHCKLEIALGARKILGKLDLEEVSSQSRGAATFFLWVKGMIEEITDRRASEMEYTEPRTLYYTGGKKADFADVWRDKMKNKNTAGGRRRNQRNGKATQQKRSSNNNAEDEEKAQLEMILSPKPPEKKEGGGCAIM